MLRRLFEALVKQLRVARIRGVRNVFFGFVTKNVFGSGHSLLQVLPAIGEILPSIVIARIDRRGMMVDEGAPIKAIDSGHYYRIRSRRHMDTESVTAMECHGLVKSCVGHPLWSGLKGGLLVPESEWVGSRRPWPE